MRVVFVQYAGDYREAEERIRTIGEETYYAQKYSVDIVASLVPRCDSVSVICGMTKEPYNEVLSTGVRSIGAGFSSVVDEERIVDLIRDERPNRLILRTPMKKVIKWIRSQHIRSIVSLADSFTARHVIDGIRHRRLASLLNSKEIEWVFNHGLNSCISVKRIGVSAEKIVPWDWPAVVTPQPDPRELPTGDRRTLFYAGLICDAKGVGDALQAVSILASQSRRLLFKIAGQGDVERFVSMANTLGISDLVQFLGRIPHDAVLKEMRSADIVLVPSRHDYAEGFPMTIYEALCSRTPLVASDHPMFKSNLTDNVDSLLFPSGNTKMLALCVERLLSSPELYRRISIATFDTWKKLQLPVKWEDSVLRWLFDSQANQHWLFKHRLSSGIYPLDRYGAV